MTAPSSSPCRVVVAGPEPVVGALQQVSTTLGLDVDFQHHKELEASWSSSPKVGLTVSSGRKGLQKQLLQLHEAGVGPVIWMRSVPVATRDKDDDPELECSLAAFPASVRSEFSVRIRPVALTLPRLLEALHEVQSQTKSARPPAEDALSRSFRACEVFDRLIHDGFGHGGDADITNRVLGPAYLLSTGNEQAVEKAWGLLECDSSSSLLCRFRKKVIKPIAEAPEDFGEVGQTLLWAWTQLTDICKSRSAAGGNGGNGETQTAPPANPDSDLVRERPLTSALLDLMDALTECRIAAGEKTESKPRDGGKPPPPSPKRVVDGEECYRLLVVDDHADAWRPALEEVAAQCSLPVEISFSLDGKDVLEADKENETNGLAVVEEYDAVLLDVFLGTDRTGLQLLEKIRRFNRWSPIIIWTSSREAEIPAGAVLASGFIFKKRANLENTVKAIEAALLEGRARRDPLMNRFFDTAIRDNDSRACAWRFERCCMTVMDSFHALPYYRLFNDHAGRHILGLLARLTSLLKPFMLEKCQAIFSTDYEKRQREVFRLYVAAFAHEMGMFPHRKERPRDITDKFEAIRSAHALRSLEAIWNSEMRGLPELDKAIDALRETGEDNLAAVAVLVGYHARLLSLKKRSFLKCATTKGRWKLHKAQEAYPGVVEPFPPPKGLAGVLGALGPGAPLAKERLRKQCALLRFADALDIDRTRQPVGFLLTDPERDYHNLRENGKREVVEKVDITSTGGGRRIDLDLDAPKPAPARLSRVLGITDMAVSKLTSAPWLPGNRAILTNGAKPVEDWLNLYWLSRQEADGVKLNAKSEKQKRGLERWLGSRGDSISLDQKDQAFAAGLSALNVAAEVLEEYEAVRDCGLDSKIRLGKATWIALARWQPREAGLYCKDT